MRAEIEDRSDEAGRLVLLREKAFLGFGESQSWTIERGHCRVKPLEVCGEVFIYEGFVAQMVMSLEGSAPASIAGTN